MWFYRNYRYSNAETMTTKLVSFFLNSKAEFSFTVVVWNEKTFGSINTNFIYYFSFSIYFV